MLSPPPCPSPSPEISLPLLSRSSSGPLLLLPRQWMSGSCSLPPLNSFDLVPLAANSSSRQETRGVGEARLRPCRPWCSGLPCREIYERDTGLNLVSVMAVSPSIFAFIFLSLTFSVLPHPRSLYMHSHRLYPTNLSVSSRFCHWRLCFMYSFLFKCSSKSPPRLWAD